MEAKILLCVSYSKHTHSIIRMSHTQTHTDMFLKPSGSSFRSFFIVFDKWGEWAGLK
jgi:hypothetical protein